MHGTFKTQLSACTDYVWPCVLETCRPHQLTYLRITSADQLSTYSGSADPNQNPRPPPGCDTGTVNRHVILQHDSAHAGLNAKLKLHAQKSLQGAIHVGRKCARLQTSRMWRRRDKCYATALKTRAAAPGGHLRLGWTSCLGCVYGEKGAPPVTDAALSVDILPYDLS